jgi:hypothetical protein
VIFPINEHASMLLISPIIGTFNEQADGINFLKVICNLSYK